MNAQTEIPGLSLVTESPEAEEVRPYRSILEVWQKTLEPIATERLKRPTMDWTGMLLKNWQHLLNGFKNVSRVQEHYFRIMEEMQTILNHIIEGDEEALEVESAEEDAERNKDLYIRILIEWQKALLVESHEWDVDSEDAEAIFVALGETQLQLLGQLGLAAHLQAISLPFTEEDQDFINKEVEEFRESLEAA